MLYATSHSIFDCGHIVLNYTAHIVYSPLNSYFDIHWILDFKYILILLFMALTVKTISKIPIKQMHPLDNGNEIMNCVKIFC